MTILPGAFLFPLLRKNRLYGVFCGMDRMSLRVRRRGSMSGRSGGECGGGFSRRAGGGMCGKSGFPDFANTYLPADPGMSRFDCAAGPRIVWIVFFEEREDTFCTIQSPDCEDLFVCPVRELCLGVGVH